jgi:hypothetical protein
LNPWFIEQLSADAQMRKAPKRVQNRVVVIPIAGMGFVTATGVRQKAA